MSKKISAAIQLLPIGEIENFYFTIDKAIEIIKGTTADFVVCPFETVVNCSWEELFEIQKQIGNLLEINNIKGIINLKILQNNIENFRIKLEDYCKK